MISELIYGNKEKTPLLTAELSMLETIHKEVFLFVVASAYDCFALIGVEQRVFEIYQWSVVSFNSAFHGKYISSWILLKNSEAQIKKTAFKAVFLTKIF